MIHSASLKLCVSLFEQSMSIIGRNSIFLIQAPSRTMEMKVVYSRYALVLSLVCARLRAAASLVPVQSSSLLVAYIL
jgi:hypothetical protein